MASDRFIVTGGPGSGKTSLISELSKRGFHYSPEVSRRLIQEQSQRADGVLPWHSLAAFAALVVSEMLAEHDRVEQYPGPVFFDRALPDVFGYLRNSDIAIPDSYHAAHQRCRYSQTVFLLPPWPEIYVNDAERPQSLSESVSLHEALVEAYQSLDYELIEVPRADCPERADFVLSCLPH